MHLAVPPHRRQHQQPPPVGEGFEHRFKPPQLPTLAAPCHNSSIGQPGVGHHNQHGPFSHSRECENDNELNEELEERSTVSQVGLGWLESCEE